MSFGVNDVLMFVDGRSTITVDRVGFELGQTTWSNVYWTKYVESSLTRKKDENRNQK